MSDTTPKPSYVRLLVPGTFYASDDIDIFFLYGDNATVYAGLSADRFNIRSENNYLYGGAGNDNFYNYSANNFLFGGQGNDSFNSTANYVYINAGEDDDNLRVNGEHNELIGSLGNDKLYAYGNHNILNAGQGDNRFYLDGNNTQFNAGNDNDYFYLKGIANTTYVSGGNNQLNIYDDSQTLTLGDGNDTLYAINKTSATFSEADDTCYGSQYNEHVLHHHAQNQSSKNNYSGGKGSDTLSIHFDYSKLLSLAEHKDETTVDNYLENNQQTFKPPPFFIMDFNAFSFDLVANYFEELTFIIINNQPTNRAPTAKADALTTDENLTLLGNLFLDNGYGADSDPDGDSFTLHSVNNITLREDGQLFYITELYNYVQ